MELDNDLYKRFEKIVGKRNISNDPVITVNYAYSFAIK